MFLRHSGGLHLHHISVMDGELRAGAGHGSYAQSMFRGPGSASPAHGPCHSVAPRSPRLRMNSPSFETEALRGLTLCHLALGQIWTPIPVHSVYSASLQSRLSELLTLTLG